MLGNPDSLGLGEVLLISLMGMVIVFICLIVLILAIKLMSQIFIAAGSGKAAPEKKTAPAPAAKPAGLDEETYAVLLSTVSDATGLPLDKFRVVSVTEIG